MCIIPDINCGRSALLIFSDGNPLATCGFPSKSHTDLWCFISCQPEQFAEPFVELPVIWGAITFMRRCCDGTNSRFVGYSYQWFETLWRWCYVIVMDCYMYGAGRPFSEWGRQLQFNSGAFAGLWGSYQDRITTKWFLLDRVLSLWEDEPINSTCFYLYVCQILFSLVLLMEHQIFASIIKRIGIYSGALIWGRPPSESGWRWIKTHMKPVLLERDKLRLRQW